MPSTYWLPISHVLVKLSQQIYLTPIFHEQVCLGGWFEGKPGKFGNRWVGRPLIGIAQNTAHGVLGALGLGKSKDSYLCNVLDNAGI